VSDFATLAYLDGRQIANTARDVVRKPGRALLYLLAIAYFVGLGWFRTRQSHAAIPGVADPWATLIFFAAGLSFAVAFLRAASGSIAGFSSAADARFLIGSHLDERNVVVWLQLRNSVRTLARFLFLILMYALIYRWAGRPMAIVLSMACVVVIGIGISIPTFNLRRRIGAGWCRAIGWGLLLLAIAGVVAIALALPLPALTWLRSDVVGLGFGKIITQAALGNSIVIGVGYVIAAVLIAAGYFGSADIYPELQVGSQRYIQALATARRGGGFSALAQRTRVSRAVKSNAAPRGFVGASAIVWKEWVGSRRTLANVGFWIFLACAAAVGCALGVLGTRSEEGRGMAVGFGGTLALVLAMIGSFGANVSLSADINKPLWWMGASTVYQRLAAWLGATSWRTFSCAIAGVLCWGSVSGNWTIVWIGVPAAFVLTIFIRSIGLALYALFPSAIDQRGPLAFARMLCLYVALAPPMAFGLGALVLWRSAGAAGAAAAVVAILEVVGLVAFAAARVTKNGATVAQAEAT